MEEELSTWFDDWTGIERAAHTGFNNAANIIGLSGKLNFPKIDK